MLFPRERIEFTRSFQGRTSPTGWLVLNIAGLDLDGVTKVHLDLADIERAKDRGSKDDLLAKVKSQLGGDL